MATSSIASGGINGSGLDPLLLLSSSSQRQQLKVKPPKHSFNQALKSNSHTMVLQSPVKTNNNKQQQQLQQTIMSQQQQQQ